MFGIYGSATLDEYEPVFERAVRAVIAIDTTGRGLDRWLAEAWVEVEESEPRSGPDMAGALFAPASEALTALTGMHAPRPLGGVDHRLRAALRHRVELLRADIRGDGASARRAARRAADADRALAPALDRLRVADRPAFEALGAASLLRHLAAPAGMAAPQGASTATAADQGSHR